MARRVTNKMIKDTVIELAAKGGCGYLSLRRAADKLGISEALLYRYFQSKDHLMESCYWDICEQNARFFEERLLPEIQAWKGTKPIAFLHSLWELCFAYQQEHGYETLYYYSYRESEWMRRKTDAWRAENEMDFHSFQRCYDEFCRIGGLELALNARYVWVYFLDVIGLFVRRVIRGELPNTKESRESIWRLFSGGVLGLVDG